MVSLPGYRHNAGFADLARGLHAGFSQLGYDAPIVDDPSNCSGTTIVLGANLIPSLAERKLPDDMILYNTEQIQDDSPWLTSEYKSLLSSYPVWDYSERNIAALKSLLNEPNVTLCPVGFQPELASIPAAADHDIDVLFYGSLNERRSSILDELSAQGLTVVSKFGVYGEERDALIARSKIVLNIHYYEAKVFEIVRISYLLANSRFVISESSLDPNVESHFKEGLVICPYGELVENCIKYAKKDEARRAIAMRGFQLFSQRTQADYLKMILS